MKKLLFSLLVITSLLNANDEIINVFKKQGGVISNELKNVLEKDTYFKEAQKYLTDKKYMSNQTVFQGDPEDDKSKIKKMEVKVPNFVKALESFEKSVKYYDNQVSAFYSLYIIKSYFNKSSELEDFAKFSKLLYEKEKNICTSYIDYGESLEKGYFQKINLNKAYSVYKEGLTVKNCNKGWYLNVLSAKMYSVKRKMK